MLFLYLLYLKIDRSEEKLFWYSHIFIIFEALIPYLEHKGSLTFKNVWILLFRHCLLTILAMQNFAWIILAQKKFQNVFWNKLRA